MTNEILISIRFGTAKLLNKYLRTTIPRTTRVLTFYTWLHRTKSDTKVNIFFLKKRDIDFLIYLSTFFRLEVPTIGQLYSPYTTFIRGIPQVIPPFST